MVYFITDDMIRDFCRDAISCGRPPYKSEINKAICNYCYDDAYELGRKEAIEEFESTEASGCH